MFRNQYDTDVTSWSPQGRLFQVEYAMEAVKQGAVCVGVASATHVVIAALKRSPSELASHQQKCFRVDDHMGLVISGLTADGRSLIKYLRGECANHKFVYNAPLQTERLVTDTADKHQRATQSYVRRPYGVGLLVAGYDATGPHLFQTCPSGNFYEWKAFALGSRSQSARTYLERNYDACSKMSRDELLREAAKALHTCLEPEKELTLSNCVFGVVGKGEAFTILEGDAAAPFIAGLGAAAVPGSHAAAAAAAAAAAPADAAGGDMGDAPQPDAPAAPGAMDIS